MGRIEQIIRILNDSDTQRIQFQLTFPGGTDIEVNGESFRRVSASISDNRIHVVSGGVPAGMARYSAHEEGSSAANTFYIGDNMFSSRDYNGLIVHEAVHASFDLTHTTLPWVDNESAAYVAQGAYLRNSGYPLSRFSGTSLAYYGRMVADNLASDENPSYWLGVLNSGLQNDPLIEPT